MCGHVCHVWSCKVIYGHVWSWSCMVKCVHGQVDSCMAIYGCIWSCMVMVMYCHVGCRVKSGLIW